jgi:hypothetical protein
MDLKSIDSISEQKHLKDLSMFFCRNFMVTMLDEQENILFYPCMISNFSVDGDKLFVTIYDIITKNNIEETLDNLYSHGWKYKYPTVKIILTRLDCKGVEIYRVIYPKCRLKNYHGKNFTYKSSEPYQWYLEFEWHSADKEIIKSDSYDFSKCDDYVCLMSNEPTKVKDETPMSKPKYDTAKRLKELAILNNSNTMLDDAAEKVVQKETLSEEHKNKVLQQISKAKSENKNYANNMFSTDLDTFDLDAIAKSIEKEIAELENKLR